MKILLAVLALAALAMAAPEARAGQVEISWRPVVEDVEGTQETISHYLLYLGRRPRPAMVHHPADGRFAYERVLNAGTQPTRKLEDLQVGYSWYFAVAAVDVEGNLSAYSAEVRLDIPDAQGECAEAPALAPGATRKRVTPPTSSGCATAAPRSGTAVCLCLLALLMGLGLLSSRQRR